jgi:hypothetical protein
MRKLILAALLATAPACQNADVSHVDTIEEAPHLSSIVHMSDRTMVNQLASGFYEVESNAWRWTRQKFAVNLRPPARAAQNGAVLELQLNVPATSIRKLGTITISANAAGTALAPETYSKAGDYTYRRDIPANLLGGDAVRIDFQLDKAMPPSETDQRELGLITSSVGMVSK